MESALAVLGRPVPTSSFSLALSLAWTLVSHLIFQVYTVFTMDPVAASVDSASAPGVAGESGCVSCQCSGEEGSTEGRGCLREEARVPCDCQ